MSIYSHTRIICSFSFLDATCVFQYYQFWFQGQAAWQAFPYEGRVSRQLDLDSQPFIFSYFFIRLLNPRIESRENWTTVQNRRLDGVCSLCSPSRPNPLALASHVLKNREAVNNLAGRAERWGKSTNLRRGGWWGERGQNAEKRIPSFGKVGYADYSKIFIVHAPSRYDGFLKQFLCMDML